MGNIFFGLAILCFVIALLLPNSKSDSATNPPPPPPDAEYVFKKDKFTLASSEPVITRSREELLEQCKQEFKLAEMIMMHRQINMSMTKSLEKIYKDEQFSEELKNLAKNAVVIAQDEDRYAIASNRQQAIEKFATDAQKNCLKFNN